VLGVHGWQSSVAPGLEQAWQHVVHLCGERKGLCVPVRRHSSARQRCPLAPCMHATSVSV
jgi:hypothetical protein